MLNVKLRSAAARSCYFGLNGMKIDESVGGTTLGMAANGGQELARGMCLLYGNGGFAKEEKQAVAIFTTWAMEHNHASAQNELGLCYYNGYGTDKNPKRAFHWYEKAAKQGNAAG